ncbi:MAG: indolepyruvate oxidoreductase subunit beta [Desulfovibrio sp.]|jgi:indolepyruvate ferredoxin oxidoreductase beta subunit|nr:indolepyruvate oxidoreductase subunit beta [Desulfovibrio sp.]
MQQSKQQRQRIYFTGVGGQGTLTATDLLAQAAIIAGIDAVAGEVHGMAQRGGVVESFLLLGGWRSPRLDHGEADVLLGFEPLETLRGLPYLRSGGIVFSSSDPLPPLAVSLGQVPYPTTQAVEDAAKKVAGQIRFIPCRTLGLEAGALPSGNTVLLAAACAAHAFPFEVDALEAAIKTRLPQKLQASNLKALELGKAFAAS